MTPADAMAMVLTIAPSATGAVLPGAFEEMMPAIDRVDPKGAAVLAVGPGAGLLRPYPVRRRVPCRP